MKSSNVTSGPQAKVLLISMPFAWSRSPAIGISLLKSHLERIGIGVEILYLNLEFADRIGHMLQNAIAADHSGYLGDWIFSAALYGMPSAEESDDYWKSMSRLPLKRADSDLDGLKRDVLALQQEACGFVDAIVDRIDWSRYRIVGFTSTFQQDIAALSVARRVKEAYPDVVLAFGGAHYEGEMGAARLQHFPFIDVVFSGEADATFPRFVVEILEGRRPASGPGILVRGHGGDSNQSPVATAAPVVDLDALPFPDYGDYFEQLAGSQAQFRVELPFESARGCWWGEKHHCTFCGLNGETMAFRRKSPERLIEEINWLLERHQDDVAGLFDVSNILDMRYFRDYVPSLADLTVADDFYIFCETKSNLTQDQVRLLHNGRVTRIQPGIESLSTPTLRLMRKGCTMLQNIELLKWCFMYGVEPEWNLLFGFPGEAAEEYFRQIAVIPMLHHLRPPSNIGPVRVDRFSPYFEQPSDFGITRLRPQSPYRHIYRVPEKELKRIAYYFEFECEDTCVDAYEEELAEAVAGWCSAYGRCRLESISVGEALLVRDTRECAESEWTALYDAYVTVMMMAVRSVSLDRVRHDLYDLHSLPSDATDEIVQRLCERGFAVIDEQRLLSLVVECGESLEMPDTSTRVECLSMRQSAPLVTQERLAAGAGVSALPLAK